MPGDIGSWNDAHKLCPSTRFHLHRNIGSSLILSRTISPPSSVLSTLVESSSPGLQVDVLSQHCQNMTGIGLETFCMQSRCTITEMWPFLPPPKKSQTIGLTHYKTASHDPLYVQGENLRRACIWYISIHMYIDHCGLAQVSDPVIQVSDFDPQQ